MAKRLYFDRRNGNPVDYFDCLFGLYHITDDAGDGESNKEGAGNHQD